LNINSNQRKKNNTEKSQNILLFLVGLFSAQKHDIMDQGIAFKKHNPRDSNFLVVIMSKKPKFRLI
jgi:hypothetical protein